MKRKTVSTLVAIFINITFCLALTSTNPNIKVYPADINEGIIGTSEVSPIDNPEDNVFHINLAQLPSGNNKVWLSYQLYGVQDHTAIARSINDRQAIGGYLVQTNQEWSEQKELMDVKWLQEGKNVIKFSLPANVDYHYIIKDLKLIVDGTLDGTSTNRSIVVNQPSQNYYANKAYIKGFISGVQKEEAILLVNDELVETSEGEYELFFNKPENIENWSVNLKAIYADGEIVNKEIIFSEDKATALVNGAMQKNISVAESFKSWESKKLDLLGASIEVPIGALMEEKVISITALRYIDIPVLNTDMVNVTKGSDAYRFLPHGTKFYKNATIQLDYDLDLIPEGYTEKDIRTFYFDDDAKTWKKISRDSVDEVMARVVSKTNHFTDFINGIIKVPESPETQGYKSTSIKDIKAVDPSTGIVFIEPPTANNMGTANLSYPIKIPQGRQGMQPQLAVTYNSEGGNGWMGLGWNLSIPSISVETRWGVPRFDDTYETETYTLGGQMMHPVAHRDELEPREAEKDDFHLRVEGSFNEIIRHGENPTDYWWEVTNKEGITSYYGGHPSVNNGQGGVIESAVLRDGEGKDCDECNIAYWSIYETKDLNGNYVRYHCTIQGDAGVDGSLFIGQQIYVDKITYTGHGNDIGKYSVLFKRDRPSNDITDWNGRPDIQISGRLGFKQVTADLLERIEVIFDSKLVRSYRFNYDVGAFHKTLLTSVAEYDKIDSLFYEHTFEYFDEVRNDTLKYEPFEEIETWTVGDDDVLGNLTVTVPDEGIDNETSIFSGANSTNSGFGASLTFGALGDNASKIGTIGGSLSGSKSESEGLISMIDIDGDGLADKVFKGTNSNGEDILLYRPNLSGIDRDSYEFGDTIQILGIDSFSSSKTKNKSKGLEAHPGNFILLGLNNTTSNTETKIYFLDFNGDGLIDIAKNGIIYFNSIINGRPVFTKNVKDTPSVIVGGAEIDDSALMVEDSIIQQNIDEFPLHDVVRRWEAPCDGDIQVSGDIQLLVPLTSGGDVTGTEDGIMWTIQHNGFNPLLNVDGSQNGTIAFGDNTPQPINVSFSNISKGDRIYFRLQSIENGNQDKVQWNPIITYTNDVGGEDANAKENSTYNASEDYVLASCQSLIMPLDGEIQFDGIFSKPITSDDLVLQVFHNDMDNPICTWDYSWDTSVMNEVISSTNCMPTPMSTIQVYEGDVFLFKLISDTNIDWSAISWTPRVFYTCAILPDEVDCEPLASELSFCPAPDFTMFNEVISKPIVWTASSTGTITVSPTLGTLPMDFNSTVTFSAKKVIPSQKGELSHDFSYN